MDLAIKVQYLTLDVITTVSFGGAFGFLERDEDVYSYIEMTEKSMPMMLFMSVLPGLTSLLQSPLFRRFMPSERDRVGFGQFIA